MKSLAHPDGFMFRWFSRVGDFFCLSIVWLVCCLPLVTIVPSCVALYDSVAHCVRGDEGHPCKRFFRTFRAEILRGMLLTVLWAVFAAVLLFGYQIVNVAGEGTAAAVYATLYGGTLLIPLAVLTWLVPIQSRFEYKFFELHKVAVTFTVAHLPTTAGIVGILIVGVAVMAFMPVLAVLLPAIMATLQSALIEKVFHQYMPQEE